MMTTSMNIVECFEVEAMATSLNPEEMAAGRALIDLALREDLGAAGDITTLAFIPANQSGAATIVARSAGVLAGLAVAAEVARTVDPGLTFRALMSDGDNLKRADR